MSESIKKGMIMAADSMSHESEGKPLTEKLLRRASELLPEIVRGLDSRTTVFNWHYNERLVWTKLLQRLGVILLSEPALKKQGLEPKRGAVPIAVAGYSAELGEKRALFVVGFQTRTTTGDANSLEWRRRDPREQLAQKGTLVHGRR